MTFSEDHHHPYARPQTRKPSDDDPSDPYLQEAKRNYQQRLHDYLIKSSATADGSLSPDGTQSSATSLSKSRGESLKPKSNSICDSCVDESHVCLWKEPYDDVSYECLQKINPTTTDVLGCGGHCNSRQVCRYRGSNIYQCLPNPLGELILERTSDDSLSHGLL